MSRRGRESAHMPGTDWPGVTLRVECHGKRLGDLHRRTPPDHDAPATWLAVPYVSGAPRPEPGAASPRTLAWVDVYRTATGEVRRKFRFQCPTCGLDLPMSETTAAQRLDAIEDARAGGGPAVVRLDLRENRDTP